MFPQFGKPIVFLNNVGLTPFTKMIQPKPTLFSLHDTLHALNCARVFTIPWDNDIVFFFYLYHPTKSHSPHHQ